MTATLISLISIVFGILGANGIAIRYKNRSFGFIGNTIAGVFGSILLIKSFGRLGFNPQTIVIIDTVSLPLFAINCVVSFLGGALAVFVMHYLKNKLEKPK
ncbi:hypothetical protein ES677_00990 [Bizionia gelidisalsuginis]|uniref:Uncharacterized protein n=2 Tax=Bizionia TaxID=283785 RepID=A0A8H2LG65_9FLAO|nr:MULTISPECIES: hypothetical protein [Bizionia]TYB77335.1 hypothetical protein ES676_03320 [Bizionia saleffrena]TYC17983.1 hypothetical protein ES677_00990 [Bizionia gelidisalsuginis]